MVQTSYIKESYAENESKCMASCVRLEGCWAFNYHVTNKTCILMQKVDCMATSSPNSSGYLFVHLQSCMMQPVQFSVRPADLGWHWITVDDASKVNGYIPEMPSDTARYVSRILYRGCYLIGWWSLKGRGSLFRAVDPVTRQMIRCPIGEFLVFPNNSSYVWAPYTPGEPLPYLALPLSQLPDGVIFYLVRYWLMNVKGNIERISGCYNHGTKSTHFVNSGVASYTTKIDILCGIDI